MRSLKTLKGTEKILLILLLAGNISYIVYWSIFSIDRFHSLHAYVFDLGIAMESGWLIFHTPWTISYLYHNFYFISGRILLSPLFVTGNFPFILIVQTVAISSGSLFIFLIAKKAMGNGVIPLLLSMSYLIYFPIAGANFYDFHYQVFFIPFFLSGFYCYLQERYVLSIAILTISGLFRFPYMAFPLALALIEIATMTVRTKMDGRDVDWKKMKFLVLGSVIFSIFLILGYLSITSGSSTQSGAVLNLTHGSAFALGNIKVDLDIKIFTATLILGGLLFYPLKSKYMILTIPYFLFVFFYDYKGYYYPNAFQNQYAAAIVPFLFIGIIDVLKHYYPSFEKGDDTKEESKVYKRIRKNALRDVVVLFIALILFAQVFQPYGALNSNTEDSFGSSYILNNNTPNFNVFQQAVNLIPKDTPANEVLVQNDLPFVYPLPADFSSPVGYMQTLTYNNTAFYNNYTELGSDGKFYPLSPKYVVMYPYGSYGPNDRFGYFEYVNLVSPPPNNISNFMIVTHLTATGDYGILAEADGLFILEKGYNGPLEYYVPFTRYYPYTDFHSGNYTRVTSQGIISNSNMASLFFYGPPTALSPGKYEVTYYFRPIVNNTSGIMGLTGTNYNGLPFFSKLAEFNGTSNRTGFITFTYDFNDTVFTVDDQFNAYINFIHGELAFVGISINQISGP